MELPMKKIVCLAVLLICGAVYAAAARKALEDERKRLEQAKTNQVAQIAASIEKLQQEAKTLLDHAFEKAGVSGRNPYPGSDAAQLRDFQQNLKYHTTANWDYQTREEAQGALTPTMKRWLLRVRGY
jgi:type II secretory pathway pseudopilin PulG